MATLHLVCLNARTGKPPPTRYLRRELRAIRLAPDEWLRRLGDAEAIPSRIDKLEAMQWEVAERALLCGVDVLFEVGAKTCAEREPYRTRAAALGAETRIYADCELEGPLTLAHGVRQAPGADEGW